MPVHEGKVLAMLLAAWRGEGEENRWEGRDCARGSHIYRPIKGRCGVMHVAGDLGFEKIVAGIQQLDSRFTGRRDVPPLLGLVGK